MTTGLIFDIKRFSIHDGPGIRTTVFFKGCPLSCWWCHNPEGQAQGPEIILRPERCIVCGACLDVCTRGAISSEEGDVVTDRGRCAVCSACVDACFAEARHLVGRRITVSELMDEIIRDRPFYHESGGVTFSGGEPLSQPDFLREILKTCREENLHTVLDTCGFAAWDDLDSVREDIDLFLYDLKVMDSERHRQVTGVSNERILENLLELSQQSHRIILRVPIIPGINDDDEAIRALGAFAAELPSLDRVDLLPYHRIGRDKYQRLGKICPMPEINPPSDERIDTVVRRLRGSGLCVRVE